MIEAYNISNAVATWVVPILAFTLSLATFIQSHYNVRPKFVQDGREVVSVASYKRLERSHAKLVARVAALEELHGTAPITVPGETLSNIVSRAATEVAANIPRG
ncbi:hypothetical protein BGZ60DRAFT_533325 [Tricladium varicosporioides]|nr:hypothetical protein BGZ60DRAFT_533325 [Hymenoscyphus varicosporioides]